VELNLNDQFMGEVMLSTDMRNIVEAEAHNAQFLYQSEVAKRTGLLAASAHAHTEIGGQGRRVNDRHIGVLTVGGQGSDGTVVYAASHDFGAGDHPGSTGRHHNAAADDLQNVLEQLGKL
jgi:hypothetical protein